MDKVLHCAQYAVAAIIIPLNMTLMHVIWSRARSDVGNYRYLIISFTLCSTCLSICNAACLGSMYNSADGSILVSVGLFREQPVGRYLIHVFMTLIELSFVILALHFIYRYIIVCRPTKVYLMRKYWFVWLPFVVFVTVQRTYAVIYSTEASVEFREVFREELIKIFDADIDHDGYFGYLYMENGHFRKTTLGALIIVVITDSIIAIIIVYCGYKIRRVVKSWGKATTSRTKNIQKQFFQALFYQTLIPMTSIHGPTMCSIALPLLGVPLFTIGCVMLFFITMFPLLDSIVVIYFIKDYRKAFLNILGRKTEPSAFKASSSLPGTGSKSTRPL